MANLLERFKLQETKETNARYKKVPDSTVLLSRDDEKLLHSMTVFECEGNNGTYKALKVVFKIDDKLCELSPWPTLDFASMKCYEHMDSIDPMLVRFYEQEDIETGDRYNKVHIIDRNNEGAVEKARKIWNER